MAKGNKVASGDMSTESKEILVERKDRLRGPLGIGVAVGAGMVLLFGGAAAGFAVAKGGGDSGDRRADRNGQFPSGMAQGDSSGMGAGGMGGGMFGGGSRGEVTAVSATSISLKDERSGGVITFDVNDATTVTNDDTDAGIGDIKIGDTVRVQGTTADDDSLASSITINPSTGTGRF